MQTLVDGQGAAPPARCVVHSSVGLHYALGALPPLAVLAQHLCLHSADPFLYAFQGIVHSALTWMAARGQLSGSLSANDVPLRLVSKMHLGNAYANVV